MRTDITIAEARSLVLAAAEPLAPEQVGLAEAHGRVLAEDVVSGRTLPPADCSAMDGYALRAAAASRPGTSLAVVGEVPAGGHRAGAIGAAEVVRIFTGAPLPEGADCVVRQEDAEAGDGVVHFRIAPKPGDHVRPAGEDVRVGDPVLAAGDRLGPGPIGMLASLGRTVVPVHRLPRVAILSGGDELVAPDGDVSGGRIVASNAWSLAAQCQEAGALPLDLGIAKDDPADLERLARGGLGADLLVSSAGVSVGDHDHVRGVFEKLGCRLAFWGVRIKPGYPATFGGFDDGRGPLFFGLPGNPVSAMVVFELLVRPVLRKLGGHRHWFRPVLEAVLEEDLRKQAGRQHYVRVTLERRDGHIVARSTGNQSSGVLRSMTRAHGLLVFPADATHLAAGDTAPVELIEPDFLATREPVA